MRWPSKDPDDYTQPGPDPPRRLAWLRGRVAPDPAALWRDVCAGAAGFVLGGLLGEMVGVHPLGTAGIGIIVVQTTVQIGWNAARRRSERGDAA